MVQGPAAGAGASGSGATTFLLRALDAQGTELQAAAAAVAAARRRPQDAQQPQAATQQQQQGGGGGGGSHFDAKTDRGSAELYFHYYSCLQHQQNMLQVRRCVRACMHACCVHACVRVLSNRGTRCHRAAAAHPALLPRRLSLSISLQDYIRTGTYYSAIVENPADFEGKAVMDVGCGSGILSLFAAQAGARVVYAVEASGMAAYARQLAAANPGIGDRIRVLHGKVEEIEVPEKVRGRLQGRGAAHPACLAPHHTAPCHRCTTTPRDYNPGQKAEAADERHEPASRHARAQQTQR